MEQMINLNCLDCDVSYEPYYGTYKKTRKYFNIYAGL